MDHLASLAPFGVPERIQPKWDRIGVRMRDQAQMG